MLHNMFLDKKYIGQKLKEYRKKAGLNQEKLAEKLGLAFKHYGRLERGICVPTLETFFKLIKVLNIPIREIVPNIQDNQDNKRIELLKRIYMLSTEEIEAYLDILDIVKKIKK